MGLDFLRDQKKQFEEKRDASRSRELDTADLLSRGEADEEVLLFTAILIDPEAKVTTGLRLMLRAFSDSDMELSQNAKRLAQVASEDCASIAALMKKNKHHTGILTVVAVEPPDIAAEFRFKALKRFKLK